MIVKEGDNIIILGEEAQDDIYNVLEIHEINTATNIIRIYGDRIFLMKIRHREDFLKDNPFLIQNKK